ncbi:S4 domain-containing protein YaaA [Geomicrobium sp. JCM 19039]|uniref:S4 domain-containing protein YaaA n=1 Tax=Geomicrobium sp. JCM 19039 TaxID=1460636 RepID=UPI00045F11F2|nr:S4 domain-containing protein YaaA [Geomicrobium sp. JCM 19039]GAK11983.1 hypothetical protein JCM19039_1709 [Geomicrobium sp. JCM 19039]
MTEKVTIQTEYITLGQLLKQGGVVGTGGMVKMILAEYDVRVNGEPEERRGRKLYPGDLVEVEDSGSFVVAHTHDDA